MPDLTNVAQATDGPQSTEGATPETPPANFGLSVFSQSAAEPSSAPYQPVSDLASQTSAVAPPTSFTTQTQENYNAQQVLQQRYSGDDAHSALSLWWQNDSSWAAINRMAASSGFPLDPDYHLPTDPDEWDALTKGIPEEFRDRLTAAVSEPHAEWIANEIRHELQTDEEWSTHSHSTLKQLGAGLLDPVNIGLMLTGAGELNSATRVGRFLVGGARAGIENAGITAFLDSAKQTSDGHDIAAAALTGFMLGGAFHSVLPGAEADEQAYNGLVARRQLGLNELADRIEQGQVPEAAVDPRVLNELQAQQSAESATAARAHADAQVNQLDTEVNEHLANEETRLSAIAEGPDGEAVARQDDFSSRQSALDDARGALDEAAQVTSGDRATQVQEEAVRLAEADHPNAYARARAREAGEEPPVFPKWQQAAEDNVAHTRANAAQRAELARNVIASAQSDVDRVNRVRAAESDLEQLRGSVKSAQSLEDRVEALPNEKLRDYYRRNLKAARDDQANAHAVQPLASGSEPVGFGADTLSAARATTDVAPAVEINPATSNGPVPQSSRAAGLISGGSFNPLKTFSSVLRGSSNPIVRSRLGRMFGEAIAARDGSAGTVGASDHMQVLAHSWSTRASQITLAHKYEWMREQGINGFLGKYSLAVQDRWAESVGRAIRGFETDSKPVKEAARKYAELYKDMLGEAKRAGVKGFDRIETNERYLPRAFDFDRIKSLNRMLGDNGMVRFMSDSMEKVMMGSGLDRSAIESIARGYLQRTKRLALGVDGNMLNGIRLDDVEYLRGLLHDAPDVGPNQVDAVMNQLRQRMANRGGDEGSVRYSKHRVDFDETHAIDATGPDGAPMRVSIADLWSNDVHQLTERYIRTMSGATGLARVGIRSESDFAKSLAESVSSLDEYGAGSNERKLVEDYAKGGYNLLMGRPLDNEGFGMFQRLSKLSRDYAYTRSMNQAGFSIANNLIRPWTNGYAKYTSKYLPALAELFRRDESGEVLNPLMREIERFTGIGADSVNMHIWGHYEGEGLAGKVMDATGHGLKVLGRVTSQISGMTPGLVFGQRLMSLGILDRLVRAAHGEAAVPAKRLAIMGLDDGMMSRIKGQLLAHAVDTAGSNQRIRSVNWANWTDLDARDAMLTAINRESRILIHGEDIASTGLWMNKWWGKLAIQLRRFPMMAMSKQLGRALHMRDLDTVMDFMTTGTVGAMSMTAQAYLTSLGMPDDEREKYLDEKLSLGHIIAAGIQRNPYSGMLPQLVDTIASNNVGVPVFDARGSGLSGGLLDGTPSYAAAGNLLTAIGEPLRNGGQYTRREWRALTSVLPLGNALPMVWLTNAMAGNFPKSEPKQPRGTPKGALIEQAFNDEQ